MTGALLSHLSLPSGLIFLLTFGVAPGFFMRFFLLAYPEGDPRREELLAELYALPHRKRWLWVAQTLELAITTGLPARYREVKARREPPLHQRIEVFANDVAGVTDSVQAVVTLTATSTLGTTGHIELGGKVNAPPGSGATGHIELRGS